MSHSIPAVWNGRRRESRQYGVWNGVRNGVGLDTSWTKGRCFSQLSLRMEDKKEAPSETSGEVTTRGMSLLPLTSVCS